MKFTKFVPWLKVLSVLSLVCCFTFTVTAENYYPSEIGNTWVLLSADGSEQITYALEAPENNNIDGLVELKITSEVIGTDGTKIDTYFVTVKNNGDILLHQSITDQGVLGTAEVAYDPPVTFFPAELPLGETWQIISETELAVAGALTSTSTITVVAIEDVETPAGVFKDCVKLEIKQRDVTTFGVLRKTSYQWLGPDIGPVKYLNNQDIAYELQSYNLIEPIAEEAPLTEITEPTELTTDVNGDATDTVAQVGESASDNYTFETIDVPGVDFLQLSASSDFGDYAGSTRSADGEKIVGFTLIDGVFKTYDFPGSKNTYFFALGNNGNAAGHYEDSDGLFHGVVLENGELRQYDFPGAVETELWGISDSTGALTGNFIDASGIRRGFTGDEIIEFPGASETYADFVNASGGMVGSFVDADGLYHPYIRTPRGRFVPLNLPRAASLEYFFVHGINDENVVVARAKPVDGVPLTYVGSLQGGLQEFKVPGSVSTEGYNINQDGSIVGHYDTEDGRRHGFIARPITDTAAPVEDQPVATPADLNYTFESIDVPGVDFLALTASSDFEDYAGYTKSADGQKDVAFTLIDGVFTTYDFPGSQNTYFYALGNNGNAAGHYEDSDGLYHGVILEDGALRQYDFPGAVQTEIYGISDATGALTGNFIGASGVRRGFSGETIVEAPGASETYADFINASGLMVGSYIDAEGVYHPYTRGTEGRFITFDLPEAATFEYFFVHGINDVGTLVSISKRIGGVPRTSVGSLQHGLHQVKVPGSVVTEGWNINQDGSVVGHYDSPDGRRHGFIARPATAAVSAAFSNAYTVTLSKGLNMLSVPLAQPTPMTAKSLIAITGATTVITLDTASQQFVAWTPDAPDDGFRIEGGKGYIVNVPEARNFAFVGAPWTNQSEAAAAAPTAITPLIRGDSGVAQEAWAFVVSGHLEGKPTFDGYKVIVRNLRTNSVITASVQGDYFAAATADLTRRSVVQVGDVVEVRVIGTDGNFESQTLSVKVTPEHLANAVLSVRLDSIGQPVRNLLLQNYPNPFNPETWIPYQLSEASLVSVSIYDTTGQLVRTLSLGFQSAGFYNSRERAAYWDGRNALGERVASGIYFYQLTTPSFQQTRRLVILK